MLPSTKNCLITGGIPTSRPIQENEPLSRRNSESPSEGPTSGISTFPHLSVAAGRSQQYLLHEQLRRSTYDGHTLNRFPIATGLFTADNKLNSLSTGQLKHLAREREKYGRMLANSMQGGAVSSIEGMFRWAEAVYEYVRLNPFLSRDMIPYEATRIYRATVIKVPDEEKCSKAQYFDTLETIGKTNQVIEPLSADEVGSRISVFSQGQINMLPQLRASPHALYASDRKLALRESFFLQPVPMRITEGEKTGRSRLVLNPHPRHMPLLARAMAAVISKTDQILSGKVGAYNWLGNRSDDAMLYFCFPDLNCAQNVAETLKEEIKKAANGETPHDMFLPVQPPGTEYIDTGIYYAEAAPGHNTSIAADRGKIVGRAVVQSGSDIRSLSENLRQALLESGYNPDVPAKILRAEIFEAETARPGPAAR